MKRHFAQIITVFVLLLVGSCQQLPQNEAIEQTRTEAYNEGHQDGYVEGFNAGFAEPKEGLLLFKNVNPNIWKTTYVISVITIIFALLLVLRSVLFLNYTPSEWKKTLAKWLVLLVGLLVSYFIVPRVNLIWFFDPGFHQIIAYLICVTAIVGIYFAGKKTASFVREKRSDNADILIILITSTFLWFVTYIVMNGQYLFGHEALFGHHLIICFAIGIISFNIHLLLKSDPTPEEDTNPILNHDEKKDRQ